MKKIYNVPRMIVLSLSNTDNLCDSGLTGWSANNESNRRIDSVGDTDEDKDPEFGVAGAKRFNCWSTWDDL